MPDSTTTPDATVTDFFQGSLGDCWFLSAVKSISISLLGQQVLRNVINVASDSASVHFQSTQNYTYQITLANLVTEINDVDSFNDGHSQGDADVVLLEMALKDGYNNFNTNIGSPYDGGSLDQGLSLITGKRAGYFSNDNNDLAATTATLNELALIIDHTAITTIALKEPKPDLGISSINHAYSIVGINAVNKTVSFRNPWDSGAVLAPISYDNFSYYFQGISWLDFTTVNLFLQAGKTGGYLNGGVGNDQLWGNIGNDNLNGGAGSDDMRGLAGDDQYYVDDISDIALEDAGNQGNDTVISTISWSLNPNFENLTLTGVIAQNAWGNELNNILIGNTIANYLDGGPGSDTLYGGLGIDTLYGGPDNDTLYGGQGNDTLFGGKDNDLIYGAKENDILYGALGDDSLLGGQGNDILLGGQGNDFLDGANDNDILNAGLGNDTLTGGAGWDYFTFSTALSASANVDTLADFSVVEDTIQLSKTIFSKLTNPTPAFLSASSFHASSTGQATDSDDYIVYNTSTGALFYDADGSGAGVAVQFATLTGNPALTNQDFVVVA